MKKWKKRREKDKESEVSEWQRRKKTLNELEWIKKTWFVCCPWKMWFYAIFRIIFTASRFTQYSCKHQFNDNVWYRVFLKFFSPFLYWANNDSVKTLANLIEKNQETSEQNATHNELRNQIRWQSGPCLLWWTNSSWPRSVTASEGKKHSR